MTTTRIQANDHHGRGGGHHGRGGGFTALAVLALVGAVTGGCAAVVPNATVASSATIAAVPDQATIVVVQPTRPFTSLILDAHGKLVGQLNGVSHTVIRMPAGPVRLYLIVQAKYTGDRLDGNVEAGKIYYASVGEQFTGLAFLALNPRSQDDRWSHKDEWIRTTPGLELDPQRAVEASQILGDPASRMRRADSNVDGMGELQRRDRTIEAGDGLTAP